jgi:hypothetical protein
MLLKKPVQTAKSIVSEKITNAINVKKYDPNITAVARCISQSDAPPDSRKALVNLKTTFSFT